MTEFNIRTDAVDVEQIMRQIRARIREKRGVDYTDQQIQELADVKLQRFLDPKGVRSDLVDQFKRARTAPEHPPVYGFEDTTLYETHRGLLRFVRRLLNPLLKLLFNPNQLTHVLHMQAEINRFHAQRFHVREELDGLYYEVIHNLVLEVTRLGIETKNLKMRVESLSSRMDFDERRARALEGVVQYKPRPFPQPAPAPGAPPSGPSPVASSEAPAAAAAGGAPAESGAPRRKRRRRRGRRGGRGRALEGAADLAGTPPHGDPTGSAALPDDQRAAGPDAGDASADEFDDEPDQEAGDEPAGGSEPSGQ